MSKLAAGADLHADLLRLQTILNASSDCIKILDLDARLLSMNTGGMAAMEIEDFQSCRYLLWPDFWEGEDRVLLEAGIQAASAGRTFTFEGQARTFAGSLRWWEVRISPLRDPAGEINQLLAISRDVTARKVAEQQLQDQRDEVQLYRLSALERQAGEKERALEAFVRFTTTVASSTDLEVLGTAATEIFREVLGDVTSGFYLIRGELAHPVAFSSNTPPELQAARREPGVSIRLPVLAEALNRPGVTFVEHDEALKQTSGYALSLSGVAYHRHGQPYAFLTAATRRTTWTTLEKAILESVSQALGMALERVHQVEALERQNEALLMQAQALESERASLDAFVAFTERSGHTADLRELARQAIDLLRTTLGDISVA